MVFFFLAPLIPPIYLSVRVLRSHLPLWLKVVTLCLLVLASQAWTLQRLFFKSIAGPDMSSVLLKIQVCFFVAMVLLFLGVVAYDLVRLALCVLRRLRRRTCASLPTPDRGRRSFVFGGMASAVCGSLAFSASLVAKGTALPVLHRTQIAPRGLPSALKGLRIVQLSDLHFGPLTSVEWARATVDLAMSVKPDLVCVTGDFADGFPQWRGADGRPRREAAMELGGLHAPLGVFACTGNHEYYSAYPEWMHIYQQLGIRFLHDESVPLLYNGNAFMLAGFDDQHRKRVFPEGHAVSPETVFDAGVFCVVMEHRPVHALRNALVGAGLQLSGHTHGGQCLGMDRVVAKANAGFVRGWYDVNGMPLYVSAGAGLWPGFSVRLGIPAEVTEIKLV